MPTQSTQIFLGDTQVPFYYLGDTQVGANPISVPSFPNEGLIYALDATNPASYPGSGSQWNDVSPNKVWAAPFSSSVFPTYNSVSKSLDFNGINMALMAAMSSSILTGSVIENFTQIIWVKVANVGSQTSNGIVNFQSLPGTATTIFDGISFDEVNNTWRLTSDNNNRNVNSNIVETVFNDYLMIAATRTSGTNNYRIYRNGGDASNIIGTASFTPNKYGPTSLYLYSSIGNALYNGGIQNWNTAAWFTGSLSSVLLYNRVLTAAELQTIYDKGRFGIEL